MKFRFEYLRNRFRESTSDRSTEENWVDSLADSIESADQGWQRFCDATAGFAEVSDRHQLPIVFFLLPRPGMDQVPAVHAIHAAVKKQLEQSGLMAFDLTDVWSGMPLEAQVVSAIDHHPSAAAHQRVAIRMAREIRTLPTRNRTDARDVP